MKCTVGKSLNLGTEKPRNFETQKLGNQETKKQRNQAKTRSQETNKNKKVRRLLTSLGELSVNSSLRWFKIAN